jgi:hypothetical protein
MSEERYIRKIGGAWDEIVRSDGKPIDSGRHTAFRIVTDSIDACALANYADREARKETAEQIATLTAERDAALKELEASNECVRSTEAAWQREMNIVASYARAHATLTARVAELEGALRWYQQEASAIQRNLAVKNTDAVEASMTVLSLDGGQRAAALLTPAPPAAKPETTDEPKPTCGTCGGKGKALGDADGAAVYYPCPDCTTAEGGGSNV